jgi:hypothetical protein
MKELLRSAISPVNEGPMDRDLWPAMLRRMHEKATPSAASIPWWDWALVSGLVAFAAVAPRSIPVILYYL